MVLHLQDLIIGPMSDTSSLHPRVLFL